MVRNRNLLTCGLLLLGLLGVASCKKKEEGPAKKITYTGPTVETSNVLTLISDSAKLQIRLKAPLELTFESGDQIYPKGMNVLFYSKDGKKVVNTLQGKYGKYEKGKNLYTVRGDVRVSNEEQQQKMYTEEMFYDKLKNIIYTDSATFAKVITPTDSLTGYGLTYNMATSRYRFSRPTGAFTAQVPAEKQK
ncbi:LPS export ABC transporter periplasmic protein LptC [Hymenobacter sp. GOD-10R]|uniref:LPS export ABC transporter periplasmic protein LptC n=1 Tax=Hymenobacter sp. GOD-10R TaxID=3093922 RepID=UPI002D789042|nr:LPS export ABC transporter periplasmic protein LptC [Hymenobacter sp. GOD-10R]WRQ28573.1 LPS export ABC transporter periplasmic protein LptC [Hymenobacter sp. GOD-10R]